MEIAAVWPIVENLEGVNHLTMKPTKLNTFQKGFMDIEEARKLEKDGKLQMMAGLDVKSLIQEGDNAPLKKAPAKKKAAAKKKSSYNTKVMTPDGNTD